MFCRRSQTVIRQYQILKTAGTVKNCGCALYSADSALLEPPRKFTSSERKPWVTHINELKRRAGLEKKGRTVVREATLGPPENGLLVQELVPVARGVLAARTQVMSCASRVALRIPVYVCSVWGDVRVGDPPHKIRTCDVSGSQKNKEHTWERGNVDDILPVVESFHLYGRLGRPVSHNERLQMDRIPAIVELCIHAGVDVPEYPTRRLDFPVNRVAGRIIDFEKKFPKIDLSGKYINPSGFWEMSKRIDTL